MYAHTRFFKTIICCWIFRLFQVFLIINYDKMNTSWLFFLGAHSKLFHWYKFLHMLLLNQRYECIRLLIHNPKLPPLSYKRKKSTALQWRTTHTTANPKDLTGKYLHLWGLEKVDMGIWSMKWKLYQSALLPDGLTIMEKWNFL